MYSDDLLQTVVNDTISVDIDLIQNTSGNVLKRLDKNYNKVSIPFNNTWTNGKYYKRITIENYGSGSTGTRIRNAVTGVYYEFIVGSTDENMFFKVIDSTGRNIKTEPLMLYYDSPKQYENHHFTSVSQEVKQKWYNRTIEAQKRINVM